jgi:hypothetical protein
MNPDWTKHFTIGAAFGVLISLISGAYSWLKFWNDGMQFILNMAPQYTSSLGAYGAYIMSGLVCGIAGIILIPKRWW